MDGWTDGWCIYTYIYICIAAWFFTAWILPLAHYAVSNVCENPSNTHSIEPWDWMRQPLADCTIVADVSYWTPAPHGQSVVILKRGFLKVLDPKAGAFPIKKEQ